MSRGKLKLNTLIVSDEPGGLKEILHSVKQHGIDLGFLFAHQRNDGTGIAYVMPKDRGQQKILDGISEHESFGTYDQPVIPLLIDDLPGSLEKILVPLGKGRINLSFCFAISLGSEKALVILGIDSLEEKILNKASDILASVGVTILGDFSFWKVYKPVK